MRKKLIIILFLAFVLLPIKAFATDGFSLSNSSITMYPNESKTITITSINNAVGKLNISSSNGPVALVSTDSIFIQNPGSSGSFTISSGNVGTATISVVASENYATLDEEILTGQTRTVTVNVIAKPATELPPTTPSNPNQGGSSSTSAQTSDNNTKKSNDATLKELSLDVDGFKFNSKTTEYYVTVAYDIDKIDVKYVASDEKAKVEVSGNTNLKVGNNEVIIKVTAEDGTTKNYVIKVTRKENKKSSNTKIKKIKIDNYNLDFDSSKNSFDLLISNENALTIKVELDDNAASYKVVGNNKLKDGSKIKIIVTAEDGTTKEYTINIKKDNNSNLKILLYISLVLNLCLFLVIFIFILKRKKRKKVVNTEVII